MNLTENQKSTLKALAMADQDAANLIAIGDDMSLAAWFNTPTTSYIWRTRVPSDEVFDAITWANLTPFDTPDDTAIYTNRGMICLAKLTGLQLMLGREYINAAKATFRNGLSDALLNVPSGAGGATQSAGWAGVKAAISRFATRAEAALATGAGTQGNPSTPAIDGNLDYMDMPAIKAAA